eukprot:gene42625-56658_t
MSQSIGTRNQLAFLSLPAVVFTVALIAFPFAYTVWMSLQEFSIGGTAKVNHGLNYLQMVQDAEFWNGLKITLVLYVLSLVMQLVLGTYVALLLHTSKKLSGIVRTLMISPFVLPPVVVGMMWLVVLDPSIGAANYLLTSFGLPRSDWLASPQWVIPTVAFIDTWQWTPYVALIVLGGLQSLPPNVFEAAQIDGASRWKAMVYIVIPVAVPGILSSGIIAFTLSWNEFIYALVFLSSPDQKTVPVGVTSELIRGDVFFWGPLMAGALLGSIPVAIVYSFFVEHYVSGLTGSVKG